MAAIYLVSGGNGNWNSTTNWSATSGGASGASYPVAGDDVIFDVNSLNANITVNVISACATLTCSDYTGTLTRSTTLSTTGNLVFSTGMTCSGTGLISFGSNIFSIISNGVNIGNATAVSSEITLLDDVNVGNWNVTGASGRTDLNSSGFKWRVNGNLTTPANKFLYTDINTTIVMSGTGNVSLSGRNFFNLEINTSGTITYVGNANLEGTGLSMTYTSGTVIPPSIQYTAPNRIWDCEGMTFNSFVFNNNGTVTLLSKLDADTITIDAAIIFDGAAGWETNVFNLGTTANAGRTITLLAGNTYKVNTDFNSIRSTNSSRAVLKSSDAVNMAIFTCGAGCVMNVAYTNAIRIDSSLGKQVYSFNGVYTTAINWSNTFPVTVAYAFQN